MSCNDTLGGTPVTQGGMDPVYARIKEKRDVNSELLHGV